MSVTSTRLRPVDDGLPGLAAVTNEVREEAVGSALADLVRQSLVGLVVITVVSIGVGWLVAEHRIRLSDWIAMNLLPQTLLGGLATSIGGLTFTTLRQLTQIVAAAVAALALMFFRVAGLRRSDALMATLSLIAMPVRASDMR